MSTMPCRAPRSTAALLALPLVLAGCPGGEPEPALAFAWQVVLDEGDLDRAVLSIWGTGPSDVFAVGGPLGNGQETLALHVDGASWRELSPGGDETFWWVSGSGPGDVWMVGERGRIARWDGASFSEHASGTDATLWGVIAFSPTDAWAVGGTPGALAGDDDVVLRWDGATWSPEVLPGQPLGSALYKVWGVSSEDLYVVGENGTIWHRAGATWELQSDPPIAQGTLFTVHGCGPSEVYAVGGDDVLRSDGQTWSPVDVVLTNSVNGVSCGGPGDVAIVGFGGLKQRLVDGAWVDDFQAEPHAELHAVWAEGGGVFWATGGDFLTKASPGAPRKGVVARYGPGQVAGSVAAE